MITDNKIQINQKLKKPELANIKDINQLKLHLSHHSSKGVVALLNCLVGLANSFKNIFPSQSTIAQEIDRSVTQTNRIIGTSKDVGLIQVIQRRSDSHRTIDNPLGIMSNIYQLHPIFYDMKFRDALKDIIPNLKYLPLSILIITSSIETKQDVRPLGNGSRSKHVNVNIDYNNYYTKQIQIRARRDFSICNKHVINIEETVREGLSMNDTTVLYDNAVFSDAVRRAGKEFSMSAAGMCSISSFNDMVINVVLKRIEHYSLKIRNPYGLFVSLCNQVSRDMKIPVKHEKAYSLASELDIQLGKNEAILEGGNQPREPQGEVKKLFSQPLHRYTAPIKVSEVDIESLRAKNPHIPIVGVEVISQDMYRIQHVHDVAWRETTQEERDMWVKRMQELRSRSSSFFERFIPLDPPLMFQGDPNVTAFKIYHADSESILHDPEQKVLGCKRCDKERKIC